MGGVALAASRSTLLGIGAITAIDAVAASAAVDDGITAGRIATCRLDGRLDSANGAWCVATLDGIALATSRPTLLDGVIIAADTVASTADVGTASIAANVIDVITAISAFVAVAATVVIVFVAAVDPRQLPRRALFSDGAESLGYFEHVT